MMEKCASRTWMDLGREPRVAGYMSRWGGIDLKEVMQEACSSSRSRVCENQMKGVEEVIQFNFCQHRFSFGV